MTSEQASIVNYSVVIPAYNEQGNIKPLLERIEKVMADVEGTYEIVIVDNGSFDGTPVILDELVGKYPSLVIVTLSRNFGYDGAITTGLEYAQGSWVIIMDGDQQDPPEVIPEFIEKAKEGYSIVYGIRVKRTEGWIVALQMKTFYHCCGSIYGLLPGMVKMGVDILNPVQCSAANMEPRRLKREFGDKLVFWGAGMDTQKTFPFGTEDEVREEVAERIRIFAPGGGFVFNAIHNIQANVPPRNITAAFETATEMGQYPIETKVTA